MPEVTATVLTQIATNLQYYRQAPRWLVAFSGGMDSSVLLHALMQLKHEQLTPQIEMIHVHHGLQKEADLWAAHAAHMAHHYAIPHTIVTIETKPVAGESIEAWARSARYAAIQSLMNVGDVVLFAHHQQDQVETVIGHLMRGAGPLGAAGMPKQRSFGRGILIRPMLELRRVDIVNYAQQHQLQHIQDPSNHDKRYTRNYIRHQVLPTLESRWPSYQDSVQRFIKHATTESDLLKQYLAPHYQALCIENGYALNLKALLDYDDQHIAWFIRHWMRQLKLPMPTEKQLVSLRQMMMAAKDRQPSIRWVAHQHEVIIRRYRDALYVMAMAPDKCVAIDQWAWQQPLTLSHGGVLDASQLFSAKQLTLLDENPIRLQWDEQGKTVKKYWQTRGVPPWCRNYLPRFYQGDTLLHEVDYRQCYYPWHRLATES